MQGKFIIWEGIDGCGKSTQFLKAANYIFKKSKKNYILLTREPTYRKYGTMIRELLSKDTEPEANAEKYLELYLKDRQDHLQNLILPNLKQGTIVLCDRFMYSTFAYQKAQGNDLQKIIKLHAKVQKPDLVLLIDCPAELAMQRSAIDNERKKITGNFKNEKFEKTGFLEKARQNYLELPKLLPDHNIKVIDGSKSIEEVWIQVQKELDLLFKN
ncbi:MAG: dTMP kinase [Candidatus Diapherotrites archaeon]|nr:dTMP kinase [Candidatus Diapherotrites archaeon]